MWEECCAHQDEKGLGVSSGRQEPKRAEEQGPVAWPCPWGGSSALLHSCTMPRGSALWCTCTSCVAQGLVPWSMLIF